VTLEQQFDEGTLHILRETVLAHAVAAGMADGRATDVMLAVHELAANAVRHGGGTGRMQMRATGGELTPARQAPTATPQAARQAGRIPAAPPRRNRGRTSLATASGSSARSPTTSARSPAPPDHT
jgi:hypothetical protein